MKIQVSLVVLAILAAVAPSAHASCFLNEEGEDLCCISSYTVIRRMRRLQGGQQQHRELSGLSPPCVWPGSVDYSNIDLSLADITCEDTCDSSCNVCVSKRNMCEFVWLQGTFEGQVCNDGIDCCTYEFNTSTGTVDEVQRISFEDLCNSALVYRGLYVIAPDVDLNLNFNKWCPAPAPITPGVNGDPHFRTWSGDYFDFMGGCDLTLIHAEDFDEHNAMTINIRTKVVRDYSFIESAAVKIGEDVLQINSFGEYYFNGVDEATTPFSMAGYEVQHEVVSEKTHRFTVVVDGKETIVFQTHKDWVSVKITNPSNKRYATSVGMMGEFKSGKLLGRDGVTIMEDPAALAREWQVRDDEPILFQAVRAPQYPETCQMPDPDKATSRRLFGSTVSEEAATKACERAGHKQETMEGCIMDVINTQDLEMADGGAF